MKRYIRLSHNPYPTTSFEVIGWKSPASQEAELHESGFTSYSDAEKYARSKWDYYRIDVEKVTQYDNEMPSNVRISQFKNGKEQSRSFV